MTESALFEPMDLGGLALPNRVVMAPMTRLRAEPDGTPTPEMAQFYAQRADAGLLITEGTWPASTGQSEWRVPGLETARHVSGWRAVTDAVHVEGGRIVAQLMHGGRKGHPGARFDGSVPAGASAVADPEWVHLPEGGKAPSPVPSVLSQADIARIVTEHADAARNAIAAGFDGVELHGANSYLTHQFLADNTNLRADEYGGQIAGRMRLALELIESLADAVGADRVGIRLAPGNPQFGMVEADPGPLYRQLVAELDRYGLAYLHLTDNDSYCALEDLRPLWSGRLIANVGENREATCRRTAERVLDAGLADAVSFGRGFLRNPDLVSRLRDDLPWNPMDEARLYTPGPAGYVDYPRYERAAVS
ncbi:alkene reductase [Epidermidibacterium keratini]|uniref:Alkene reductase n=1 Tax=Epidermidibacterium keratini TaxID=1891644 RepID=A0A7L4YL11_9ACTN|nr:alkene reductase [Epidermidibacterium keratini]QHB99875.1 alkene reductase [Epidermidibacterium keratini]